MEFTVNLFYMKSTCPKGPSVLGVCYLTVKRHSIYSATMLRMTQPVPEESDVAMKNGHGDRKEALSHDPDLKRRKTFNIVFVSLLLDLIGFTIILPLLPSILDYYGSHDKVSTSLARGTLVNPRCHKLKRFNLFLCPQMLFS